MSLSSLSGAPSAFALATQQQAQQQLPANQAITIQAAPGTNGAVPPTNPAGNQVIDPTGNQEVDPLAQYAKPEDNTTVDANGNPVTPAQQPATKQPVVPTAEDFKAVSAKLAGEITIDQELANKALAGGEEGAAALGQLLSGVVQQSINSSLHAGALTAQHLQTQNSEVVLSQTTNAVQDKQYVNDAVSAATTVDPELASGLKAKLLTTTITDLREQYPEAPASMLGKRAAELLGTAPPQVQEPAATDWSKEFSS